jgi:hypothetical protein
MSGEEGPRITIKASCYSCKFERSESYRVQSDSGHNVYCDHPDTTTNRVNDSRWETPDWCPLLTAALNAAKAII